MFFPTASEVFVLKTILELSKNNSVYIEESEVFEILRSAQNDETFRNALSGCIAKGFVTKFGQNGKSFYKITEEGLKQI